MATRDVRWELYIEWDGTNPVDESSRLLSATGNYRINAPGTPTISGGGIVSQCTLILNNYDRRYSTNNAEGYIYNHGSSFGKYHHKEMYLNVSIDGGSNYYRIFSGVVVEINEIAPTVGEAGTVAIDCRDYSELYLDQRASTATADMLTLYNGDSTESDVIEQFLTDMGLGGGSLTLDAGMFSVPVAWMDDESPIEECWNVAAAAGGWFYADTWEEAQPAFVYRNAQHWVTAAISTSNPDNELHRDAGDFQQLQVKYDHSELYRDVTVEWASRKVASTDTIWEPEDAIIIPADSEKTVTATFRTPVYDIETLTYSAATAGGIDISADVSAVLGTEYAQRVDITWTNAHTTYAAILKNVIMTGKPIEGGPDGESTTESSHTYWSGVTSGLKKRALRSNVWVQTETHAEVLSQMLADIHEQPAAMYTITGVKGDPERKLGQKLRLYDDTAFDTANEKMYIIGLDFSLGLSGYMQNITAIDSEVMYAYTETDPAYFVMGTNRISINSGDAGTNRGRLFY